MAANDYQNLIIANGYQGQIAAINYSYEEDSVTKIGFKKNTNIFDLIQESSSPIIKPPMLIRLGIQANPKTRFQFKMKDDDERVVEIIIGETGFYEINDVRIIGLTILDAADNVIIDYIAGGS